MNRSTLARRLLAWFRKHHRQLPWRGGRDPYPIWVSEVMLQQTQVATVIPYFNRFMAAFPTLAALAGAEEEEVLRHWEGLGYYRRARDLHRSAQLLLNEHAGEFPRDPDILRRLPGFGRYTVAAVLSQAFDCRLAILEANSRRVLCRLHAERGDPRAKEVEERLWQRAAELLPKKNAGLFNQALMELGALVCTAAAPRCEECPLRTECRARRLKLTDKVPRPAQAPRIEEQSEVAVVVRRRERVLLVRRPPSGRWGGLWEFPHGPATDGETLLSTARRLAADFTGLDAEPVRQLMTLRHSITRFRITLTCLEAAYTAGRFRSDFYEQGRWLRPAELDQYAVSAPQRRLARRLQESSPQGLLRFLRNGNKSISCLQPFP